MIVSAKFNLRKILLHTPIYSYFTLLHFNCPRNLDYYKKRSQHTVVQIVVKNEIFIVSIRLTNYDEEKQISVDEENSRDTHEIRKYGYF